ncbi:MAG: RNA methyltransferase [Bacteroidales bacterium]
MDLSTKYRLVEFLEQFILDARMQKFRSVLDGRTRHITIVLEDIFQSQNASAVLRTCECTGIQDVHIIENENQFDIHPDIVMGASKWLTLHQYNQQKDNTLHCLQSLKQQGYRLIATSPLPSGVALEELPVDQKTAILFGNELNGLSPQAIELADGHMHIPMRGFTESFNISVSAAICLNHLSHAIRREGSSWQLSDEEGADLLLDWMQKTLRNPDPLIRHFVEKESVA